MTLRSLVAAAAVALAPVAVAPAALAAQTPAEHVAMGDRDRDANPAAALPRGTRSSATTAPASCGGALRSSGVSGEAAVTVEGAAARSSAPVAGGEGMVSGCPPAWGRPPASGWLPASGVCGALSGAASPLRPKRRDRNPGLSGFVSAMVSGRLFEDLLLAFTRTPR